MEMDVLSALHSLRLQEVPALKKALVELLIAHTTDEPVSIKKARDTFSHINRRAKQGHIQIIKDPAGDETVIVSVKDPAAMISCDSQRYHLRGCPRLYRLQAGTWTTFSTRRGTAHRDGVGVVEEECIIRV